MIPYEQIRTTVVKGLKSYLNCPVIKTNQNAEPPKYPYVSYNVITLMSENKGTYGKYADGIDRKPVKQTWSISAVSDDNVESVTLANKAHEWLDHVGTTYLNDNNVIVQSVGSVSNRDNFITTDYEYKNGFDCFFTCFDEIDSDTSVSETIESIDWQSDIGR